MKNNKKKKRNISLHLFSYAIFNFNKSFSFVIMRPHCKHYCSLMVIRWSFVNYYLSDDFFSYHSESFHSKIHASIQICLNVHLREILEFASNGLLLCVISLSRLCRFYIIPDRLYLPNGCLYLPSHTHITVTRLISMHLTCLFFFLL